jgi:hypothetical protein
MLHRLINRPKTQRAYDVEPACRVIMEQIRSMRHLSVQEFSAQILTQFADGILEIERNSGLKSLGISAIKNLYLTKRYHRRWSDSNPVLQKAFDMFYVLSPEGLSSLCFQLNDIFGLIAIYSYACDQTEKVPNLDDLMIVTRAGVFQGTPDAELQVMAMLGEHTYEVYAEQYRKLPKPSGETTISHFKF